MRPPLPRIAFALCCLWLVGCGGDEPGEHTALLEESTALLEEAVVAASSPDAENKLGQFDKKFRALATRARSLDPPPKAQRTQLAQTMHRRWEPAMGKFHAASLAALEKQSSANTDSTALRELDSAIRETDSAILESLGLAPQ